MRILIIDDNQLRHETLKKRYGEADCAYGYDEAIQYLESGEYDLVSFDHDLGDFVGGVERTGATVARWMGMNGITCKRVVIHSNNPIGAENIRSIVISAGISEDVKYWPA
jgi:CheY-like chemotaxis protein